MTSFRTHIRSRVAVAGCALIGIAAGTAIATDLALVGSLHEPAAEEHLEQHEILALVQTEPEEAFEESFEHGEEMFETKFNALDGGGANVGRGQRYTRIPRADLTAPGEWANHVPSRATGPNAPACTSCHNTPGDDGSGDASANVHRDPRHSANLGQMIQRNTPHLFGAGAVQRLAEEMTEELHAQRDALVASVQASGAAGSVALRAKGIEFGTLAASLRRNRVQLDTAGVTGIDADLVVRPFQWKGSVAFLRDFNRDASHNELGMQAAELVGDGVDGDGDAVADELSIGDMTAMTVYVAAQPRPTTKVELAALGLATLTPEDVVAIEDGAATFEQIGCATCHVPNLDLADAVFREPSANPNFRDARFPGGQNPVGAGVRPGAPVAFDLTQDLPDNVIETAGGPVALGNLLPGAGGSGARVGLYGDLKRHYMGAELAESIDEKGTGASTFLTENLWGVGTTAPYLHDGRATTLTEAILAHGGEAAASRSAFVALPTAAQASIIAFLDNLVLFKLEEEGEEGG